MRAGRSRRRRPHSTLNGAMSGREGVLGEPPLIETLDEPPIGNEACTQTPSNPDAVVLGGIPLDNETPEPGERAGTGTPSASSTHDPPSLNSNRRGANVYQRAGRGRVTGYGFSGWRSCEELSLRHFFPFLKKNRHM